MAHKSFRESEVEQQGPTQLRFRVSGKYLVDLESGVRVRPKNSCETVSQDGSLICTRQTLVRSLLGLFTVRAAQLIGATATQYQVRVSAVCQGCHGRTIWSKDGFDLSSLPWLLKNTERNTGDATSISWEVVFRKSGVESNRAFGAWLDSDIPTTFLRAIQTSSGKP